MHSVHDIVEISCLQVSDAYRFHLLYHFICIYMPDVGVYPINE